ncbi:MAG: hypothetical protein HC940_00855 [Acaryochloris sp. SU_5_25]|nr:hypothetical protein [Acaryochloris sp. SU_5_25]
MPVNIALAEIATLPASIEMFLKDTSRRWHLYTASSSSPDGMGVTIPPKTLTWKTIMNLRDYPSAIASAERQLLRLNRKIRKTQTHLEQLSAEIEIAIATDPDLRNDQQRKAKRLELFSGNRDYLNTQTILNTYSDRRCALEINLQLLRNQFSVAKLEMRHAIARQEQQFLEAA